MNWILIRDVTQEECSWLNRTWKKGEIVYEYIGATYGCISPTGLAVTAVRDQAPFVELPIKAIEPNCVIKLPKY